IAGGQVGDAAASAAAGASDALNGAASAAGDAGSAALQTGADAATQLAGAAHALPDAANQTGILYFIQQSDFVGQGLFAILVLMSLVSWYLIVVKCISNIRAHRRSDRFLNTFWGASSLEQVEHEITT